MHIICQLINIFNLRNSLYLIDNISLNCYRFCRFYYHFYPKYCKWLWFVINLKWRNYYRKRCLRWFASFSSGLPNSSESKIWVLEKVNYIRGDANVDGKYDIRDATFVQKYLSGMETLGNLQLFLSDANFDGSVTMQDVTKIQRDFA